MSDIVALRMDTEFLEKIDEISEDQATDRSAVLRQLLTKGYQEMVKEQAAEAYKAGKITFSEAALRAGLTLWDMEQYLVQQGFVSSFSLDDLEAESALLLRKKKS